VLCSARKLQFQEAWKRLLRACAGSQNLVHSNSLSSLPALGVKVVWHWLSRRLPTTREIVRLCIQRLASKPCGIGCHAVCPQRVGLSGFASSAWPKPCGIGCHAVCSQRVGLSGSASSAWCQSRVALVVTPSAHNSWDCQALHCTLCREMFAVLVLRRCSDTSFSGRFDPENSW